MKYKVEIIHDGTGRSIGEKVPVSGDPGPNFKPYFIELTLSMQTPQGQIPVRREEVPLDAVTIDEAFAMHDGFIRDQMPGLIKRHEQAMLKAQAPKLAVPGGFISGKGNGHAPGHNRMRIGE